MPTYLTAVNELIVSATATLPNAVLYGENIDTGSRICGMTRNVRLDRGGRIINIGNCESTHCGVGFGLMLAGLPAVLFCKQLDFLVLGIDHFISTYSVIRAHRDPSTLGSFTVCVIVCDQGFQGPQSSFNALGDLCSLARVPGYTLTNQQDATWVLARELPRTGFRFIALSQRLFSTELLVPPLVFAVEDGSVFQYAEGDDATIVCCNFSLPEGLALARRLDERGQTASVFSVNPTPARRWERIAHSAAKTRRLVVLDDSKSLHSPAYMIAHEIGREVGPCQQLVLTRAAVDPGVNADRFDVPYEAVLAQLAQPLDDERVIEVGTG